MTLVNALDDHPSWGELFEANLTKRRRAGEFLVASLCAPKGVTLTGYTSPDDDFYRHTGSIRPIARTYAINHSHPRGGLMARVSAIGKNLPLRILSLPTPTPPIIHFYFSSRAAQA